MVSARKLEKKITKTLLLSLLQLETMKNSMKTTFSMQSYCSLNSSSFVFNSSNNNHKNFFSSNDNYNYNDGDDDGNSVDKYEIALKLMKKRQAHHKKMYNFSFTNLCQTFIIMLCLLQLLSTSLIVCFTLKPIIPTKAQHNNNNNNELEKLVLENSPSTISSILSGSNFYHPNQMNLDDKNKNQVLDKNLKITSKFAGDNKLTTTTTGELNKTSIDLGIINYNSELEKNNFRDEKKISISDFDIKNENQPLTVDINNNNNNNNVKRLLVKQLTNLIMNAKPDEIAQTIRDRRLSAGSANLEIKSLHKLKNDNNKNENLIKEDGSDFKIILNKIENEEEKDNLDSENIKKEQEFRTDVIVLNNKTKLFRRQQQQQPEHSLLMMATTDDINQMGNYDNNNNNNINRPIDMENLSSRFTNNSDTTTQEDQFITCPPDYEMIEQTSSILDSNGSFTNEQAQQLFADSSGLLSSINNNSDLLNFDSSTSATIPRMAGGGGGGQQLQCYQPGIKMIEMITKVITPILFSIIIIVGLVGNIIVMLVILEDRKTERELTPTGLLILDLSLADLSFIIFCIPFTGWDYSVGHWVFGSLWCKFNQYLIVVCALSSIYTLVLMSIDRFMAIVYPIECMSYRTSKNTLYAIYIKWIVILIMASPTISMHGLIDSTLGPGQYTCRFLADQYNPLHFQIIFFITSYLFPLILIFCLYLSLLNKLWFGTKPHGHKESIKTLESKKKVTWLVAGIVVVFALCWCPIQVMLILMRLKSHKITVTYVAIQVFSHTLGYMNSCVNPIVYAFASESFLNSFKRSSLGRFCYRCLCLNNNHNHSHNNSNHYHDRSMNTRNNNNLSTTLHNNSLNYTTSPQHFNIRNQSQATTIGLPENFNINNNNIINVGSRNGSLINNETNKIISNNNNNNNQNLNRIVSLPLEPRDRIILPPPIVTNTTNLMIQNKITTDNNGGNLMAQDKVLSTNESPITHSITSTTTITNSNNEFNKQLPKQQLVARVIQSSNQVSHRCEPTYQRELVTP